MSLIIPNVSSIAILSLIVNKTTSSGDLKLKLFSNDLIPTKVIDMSDITECNYLGYSPINLDGSAWEINNIDGEIVASYGQESFSFLEGGLLYGYFVTDNLGEGVIWVERFTGAPFELPSVGGTINISLNIKLN